jgi:hypothetical protein
VQEGQTWAGIEFCASPCLAPEKESPASTDGDRGFRVGACCAWGEATPCQSFSTAGTSACPRESYHLAISNSTFHRRKNVGRTCLERGALLRRPVVPLVHACDAATAAGNVVQHRFGNFEPHAEALQTRGRQFCANREGWILNA